MDKKTTIINGSNQKIKINHDDLYKKRMLAKRKKKYESKFQDNLMMNDKKEKNNNLSQLELTCRTRDLNREDGITQANKI
jgi:hypothetical protein